MTLLRCSTLVVRNVADCVARYSHYFDYTTVEFGHVSNELAAFWHAPNSAGKPYAIMQPASGSNVLLRFVEGDVVANYAPIRTWGWAATEICVQDVEVVHQKMAAAPEFEVIGLPKPLDGFPEVKPMQVRGSDDEILYLTEIKESSQSSGLPVPRTLVDRPFILVLACSNLRQTIDWTRDVFGFDMIDPVAIKYSMISKSFNLPEGQKVELVTVGYGGEILMEYDQYPEHAAARPQVAGALPPGVAICSINYPDFSRLDSHWSVRPQVREGALYGGAKVGLMKMPDGALLEVIEGNRVL